MKRTIKNRSQAALKGWRTKKQMSAARLALIDETLMEIAAHLRAHLPLTDAQADALANYIENGRHIEKMIEELIDG